MLMDRPVIPHYEQTLVRIGRTELAQQPFETIDADDVPGQPGDVTTHQVQRSGIPLAKVGTGDQPGDRFLAAWGIHRSQGRLALEMHLVDIEKAHVVRVRAGERAGPRNPVQLRLVRHIRRMDGSSAAPLANTEAREELTQSRTTI